MQHIISNLHFFFKNSFFIFPRKIKTTKTQTFQHCHTAQKLKKPFSANREVKKKYAVKLIPFYFAAIFTVLPLCAREEVSFATLAPKSSNWGKLITEIVREVYAKTDKQVLLRVYYGGVQGDETEVEKKIRLGQLDGGFFTGNGLGAVAFESRVLELPGMFTNYEQIDRVYAGIADDLNNYFQRNGYELLGIIDVGYAYMFSKQNIPTHDSIRSTKMWLWKGDQLASQLMKTLNIPAISVDFTEVIPSLQTGLIDGVYSTPTALISLEWQKEVSFMQTLPITLVSSGVVLSKKRFDSLSAMQRNALKEATAKALKKYKPILRESDKATLRLLASRGVKMLNNENERESLQEKGKALRNLFPQQLVTSLEKLANK